MSYVERSVFIHIFMIVKLTKTNFSVLAYLSPYWTHVKEAWSRKDDKNLHIVSYELLKKNSKEEYRKLNSFLKTNLSDEQLDKVLVSFRIAYRF